jgi:hypothetical protein
MEHSRFSASNFDADRACPGRQVVTGRSRLQGSELEAFIGGQLPADTAGYDAALGTATHELLLERVLPLDLPAETWLGDIIVVDGFQVIVDQETVDRVNDAATRILELTADYPNVAYETRVNYAKHLQVDEHDAWGTSDLIAWNDDSVLVYDYKNGRGVPVAVEDSGQLRLYAVGALIQMPESPINREVVLVIDQPRVYDEPQIYRMTEDELADWAIDAANDAALIYRADSHSAVPGAILETWAQEFLVPGEKQCRFCRAKSFCPSLAASLAAGIRDAGPALAEEFADMTETVAEALEETGTIAEKLARGLAIADQLEQLAKAYRSGAEAELLAGREVPGYKLVQGKRGSRAWTDEAEVEALVKKFRLKVEEAYNQKLKSPTQIEKVLAESPRRWKQLLPLIGQSEGKPHVAPESDKRPRLEVNTEADFDDVTNNDSLI